MSNSCSGFPPRVVITVKTYNYHYTQQTDGQLILKSEIEDKVMQGTLKSGLSFTIFVKLNENSNMCKQLHSILFNTHCKVNKLTVVCNANPQRLE